MSLWKRPGKEKKLYDASNLELYKLEYWFYHIGARQFGWDKGEARRHNFALRMMDDITDADNSKSSDEKEGDKAFLRSEIMAKPAVVQKAEAFFSASRMYVLARYNIGKPGYDTSLEQQETWLSNARDKLAEALSRTSDDFCEARQQLERNMAAAMQIAFSETPKTVEEAGGNIEGYVYKGDPKRSSRWSRQGRDLARLRRETMESFDSPQPDITGVKASLRWPQLPDDMPSPAVEKVVVLREQLLEKMLDRFNGRAAAGADEEIETLVKRTLPAALHKGVMDGGDAYDLSREHESAIARAIEKDSQSRLRSAKVQR
jgi:hypothetical protein